MHPEFFYYDNASSKGKATRLCPALCNFLERKLIKNFYEKSPQGLYKALGGFFTVVFRPSLFLKKACRVWDKVPRP